MEYPLTQLRRRRAEYEKKYAQLPTKVTVHPKTYAEIVDSATGGAVVGWLDGTVEICGMELVKDASIPETEMRLK